MIQRYYRLAGYLLPVFIVCTSAALLGARAKPSGADPYTPTKREWLCMEFNARHRYSMMDHNFGISAIRGDGPDEVLLHCGATPKTDRASFNKAVQDSRENLQSIAEKYGFDDWLTIKELVKIYE